MKRIPINKNKLFVVLFDTAMIPLAWLFAYWLRFNLSLIPDVYLFQGLNLLPVVIILQVTCYLAFKQHRGIWHFSSIVDLIKIIKAVFITTLLSYALTHVMHIHDLPRSIFPLYALLLISMLGSSRLFYRWFKEKKWFHSSSKAKRVLIIGAGRAGEILARELKRDPMQFHPVAFVDDAVKKQKTDIQGILVVGTTTQLKDIIDKLSIDLVAIAIPSASNEKMRQLVNQLSACQVAYQTLPNLSALASGKVSVKDLRDVSLEDLLGREPVKLDHYRIHSFLSGKRVMVTGGGGSIGSELCRQVLTFKPDSLLIIDHSEFNLFQIDRELRQQFPHARIHIALISVTDIQALRTHSLHFKPQIIFHAAAYKHVPMLESQIRCAIKNNVMGTQMVADLAVDLNVEKFILISTDKAVNPSNIMGATKRAAEIYCKKLNECAPPAVYYGEIWQCAGFHRQRNSFISRTIKSRWPTDSYASGNQPLFYVDS